MAELRTENKRKSYVPAFNFLFLAVAILVMYPAYVEAQNAKEERIKFEQCRKNIDTIHTALEEYQKKNYGYLPEYLDELCAKNGELEELPRCPNNERMSYGEKGYKMIQKTVFRSPSYTVFCCGENHHIGNVKRNQPYYNSRNGLHPTDYELNRKVNNDDNSKK